jgi:hypothetical protein
MPKAAMRGDKQHTHAKHGGISMKMHFQDPTFSFEFLRMVSAAVGGGSDINECFQTASHITEGDVES